MNYKLINLFLILFLFNLISVNAQENITDTDPGITPDSFLWGLDKAIDHINLLLTISPDAKASKGLEIAQERLAEIKLMVKENKIGAAKRSEEDHNFLLNIVKESVSEINETNSSNTIKKVIKIEKELENQENEVEKVNDQIKVKIKIDGTLTAEQKNLLQAFLNSLNNSTEKAKVEINEKKNEVKAEIKQESGKNDEEIEKEINDEEDNQDLTDTLKEKAQEKISNLKQKIEELKNVNSTAKEFIEARDLLEQAQSEFEKGNYQSAINIAKLGKNKLEAIEENKNEEEGNNNNNGKNEFENEKEDYKNYNISNDKNNNENNKGRNTDNETETT